MSDGKTLADWKKAFEPYQNPLSEPRTVRTKKRTTRVAPSTADELVSRETGEVVGRSMIHTIEEKDDTQFVKVFSAGIKAAFDLSRTAHRVFQAVLDAYQNERMTGGYADSVSLYWFGEGLNGNDIGMSQKTFNRGLKELLEKEFLYPKLPDVYWVNPALFFKGDRVAFVHEYRRVSEAQAKQAKQAIAQRQEDTADRQEQQTDLEEFTGGDHG